MNVEERRKLDKNTVFSAKAGTMVNNQSSIFNGPCHVILDHVHQRLSVTSETKKAGQKTSPALLTCVHAK